MNVSEFEAQLGKPPLNPKSFLPFQTLTHQLEYTPEDFLIFSNQGGNGQYSINRQKIGAGTYKYSIVSLTFGYIFTVVSDQTQTGGNTMGNSIKEYFDAHTDQRMLLKYAILFGASLAVVYLTYAMAHDMISVELVVFIPMVIAYLNEKIKPLDPNKPWAIIGAKGKKK